MPSLVVFVPTGEVRQPSFNEYFIDKFGECSRCTTNLKHLFKNHPILRRVEVEIPDDKAIEDRAAWLKDSPDRYAGYLEGFKSALAMFTGEKR